MKKLNLRLAVITVVLAACASGPRITVTTGPDTNLDAFSTFNFMSPLGTDRSSGVQTTLSQMLMNSMERELGARGLSRSDSPALLVDFDVAAQDRLDVRTTPTPTMRRSHWDRRFNTWPTYETTVRQYTEGTLVIDLIDPAANALVAEGNATNRISGNRQFTQEQIDDIVSQLMDQLWPTAQME